MERERDSERVSEKEGCWDRGTEKIKHNWRDNQTESTKSNPKWLQNPPTYPAHTPKLLSPVVVWVFVVGEG